MSREVFEAFAGQQARFGYSQAVAVDLPDDLAEQMALAYRNIADTLAHFGADMSHVVEQKVFVTDIDAAMAAMPVRKAAYAGSQPPASTMVEVSRLGLPQAKVEISVIARKDV